MPGLEKCCKKCGYEIALYSDGQTCYEGKKWCECDTKSKDKAELKKRCREAIERIESGEYVSEKEFFAKSKKKIGCGKPIGSMKYGDVGYKYEECSNSELNEGKKK